MCLKREDLQAVRSYKLRGAYNLMAQLSEDESAAGVVCASAGNHAQGFALPAGRWASAAGSTCPPRPAAEARPHPLARRRPDRVDRRRRHLRRGRRGRAGRRARTGATLVPPFDDPRTIAGQGTIAVELLDQLDGEPDLVVVPVGGGG